jgi:hypothetical protein
MNKTLHVKSVENVTTVKSLTVLSEVENVCYQRYLISGLSLTLILTYQSHRHTLHIRHLLKA